MSLPPHTPISEYLKAREDLIKADCAARKDRVHVSIHEQNADKVVRKIRAAEAKHIWASDHEGVPHPFPGMEFLTGRDIILKTELFRILRKMPKGGLLHCHLDATVDFRTVLDITIKQPGNLHVRTEQVVTQSSISSLLPEFKAIPEQEFTQISSLTDASYTPRAWVPFVSARDNFDPALGGPAGFDKWVLGSMTINPSEAYGTHNTVDKIWHKFSNTFLTSRGIIRYEPVWTEYIRQFFWSSIEDGISYVEPRINFLYKHMISKDGHENIPHRDWVSIFDRVQNEVKAELKKQGREDEFIGARIIYSTIKFLSVEDMYWYTNDCIALKQEFPHLIAGFDLVGAENSLLPIKHYLEPLLDFRKKVDELGLDLPLILHAGETNGDGNEPDQNVYDAILLGTKRVGHGFSLVKHPELMRICKERDILIEVCPISNEVLRLTSSMLTHPLPILFNHGIPVAICNDDPAVWRSTGLSFDIYQVIASSEITGLIMLGKLARDSLKYSCLPEADKKRALAAWETRWESFVKEVASMDVPDVN